MKNKNKLFILGIIFFLCSFFANSPAEQIQYKNLETIKLESAPRMQTSLETLTYERVYKGGIWWIYVYDGGKLIDQYPE